MWAWKIDYEIKAKKTILQLNFSHIIKSAQKKLYKYTLKKLQMFAKQSTKLQMYDKKLQLLAWKITNVC